VLDATGHAGLLLCGCGLNQQELLAVPTCFSPYKNLDVHLHILSMQVLLIVSLVLAAGATLFVLVKGVIGMANGSSNLTAARSQALMQKRVAYQAVAIPLAVGLMLLARG
jgi:predicted ABC-type sugar transport system permease subunit